MLLNLLNQTLSSLITDSDIVNMGISGNNTQDIIDRIATVNAQVPDLVIMLVGTNDFLNSAKLIDLAQFEINLNSIISSVNKDFTLCTIPPCIESYVNSRHTYPSIPLYNDNTLNEILVLANNVIRNVASANGFFVLDIYQLFTINGDPKETVDSWLRNIANSATDDGIHPTAEGHDAIGSKLFDLMLTNKINKNKIVTLGNSITYGTNVGGGGTALSTAENYSGRLKYYLENQ